jgi:ferric-dicitrate binding protein FerR (iron transport regulator)
MSAMECKAVLARVEDLAALSAMHAQLEEPHLVVCAECREQVARTRDVLAGLDAIPRLEPRGDLADRVMAKIAMAPPPAWASRATPRPAVPPPASREVPGFMAWVASRPFAMPAFAMAAVVALAVMLRPGPRELAQQVAHPSPIVEEPATPAAGAPALEIAQLTGTMQAFEQGTWKDLAGGAKLPAGQRVQVARGGHATLAFPDGSRVELAAESEAVPFADRVRLRRGSARFDIKHRPERTFRVLVPDGEVRVLGTLFTVDARPAATLVHLLSGHIEVQCGTQVERLEDGDSATIGAGHLSKLLASAAPATAGEVASPGPAGIPESADAPVMPATDPHPAVQATPATGPAPQGLQ